MKKENIFFFYENRTYNVPAKAYDVDLITLPDGRLLKVLGWSEINPPLPIEFKVVNTIFGAETEPEVIAEAMGAVLAKDLMFRVTNRFVMIMEWSGYSTSDKPDASWYMGKLGTINYAGGRWNNDSLVEAIEAEISKGYEPDSYNLVMTDKTAILLYLEGKLTTENLETAIERDGTLIINMVFSSNKVFEVWIKRSYNELDLPFQFDGKPVG